MDAARPKTNGGMHPYSMKDLFKTISPPFLLSFYPTHKAFAHHPYESLFHIKWPDTSQKPYLHKKINRIHYQIDFER
jgi:hypothetical protein